MRRRRSGRAGGGGWLPLLGHWDSHSTGVGIVATGAILWPAVAVLWPAGASTLSLLSPGLWRDCELADGMDQKKYTIFIGFYIFHIFAMFPSVLMPSCLDVLYQLVQKSRCPDVKCFIFIIVLSAGLLSSSPLFRLPVTVHIQILGSPIYWLFSN